MYGGGVKNMVYCTTVIMNMARVSGYGTQKASVTQVQSRISFKVFIPQTDNVPIKLRRSGLNTVRQNGRTNHMTN